MKMGKNIQTVTIPPDADRDWRIKATCGNKHITIPFPFPKGAKKNKNRRGNYLNSENAHMRAAKAICRKLGITGKIVGAKAGKGKYFFVFVTTKNDRGKELLPKLSYTRPFARNPNSKEEIRWL